MLGFVVPIAPRKSTRDWKWSNNLLNRTIHSILNQDCNSFKLYLVHEEKPELFIENPLINFIQVDASHLSASGMNDYESHVKKYFKSGYDDIMLNKGFKLNTGCRQAVLDGCSHVMCVDSDDLVSSKLARFVKNKQKIAGWQINKGYTWKEGSRILQRHNNLSGINGSTHIIRHDLLSTETESRTFYNYTLFESHGYTKKRVLREFNEHLLPLPFRGVVVVEHQHNTSKEFFRARKHNLRFFGQFILKGEPVLSLHRTSFSLKPIQQT